MIKAVVGAAGWAPDSWLPVPLPISRPDLLRYYVPRDVVFFLTIYDAWGEENRRHFSAQGFRAEVLWRRPATAKGIAATEVRRRLLTGDDWRCLVPTPIRRFIVAD
jgi:hypothetical protein